MLGRGRLLQAAAELKPYRQGDLDGLCGLYSVLNGIQLAIYPERKLTRHERRLLFDHGTAVLSRQRQLRPVLLGGMSLPAWERLLYLVLAEASSLLGVGLEPVPLMSGVVDLDDALALRRIRISLNAGAPVLITFWGAISHTTVIVGFTRARLTLFDSSRMRWVAVRSLGLDPLSKRHWFDPRYVIAIRRVPP